MIIWFALFTYTETGISYWSVGFCWNEANCISVSSQFCFQSCQIWAGLISSFTEKGLCRGSFWTVIWMCPACYLFILRLKKNNLLPYEITGCFKCLFVPPAMCTVLQLTERLLLDHAQRLPESKIQYVECTCCYWSVSDCWTLMQVVERVGLGLCTERWMLCAFVSCC